MPLDGKKTLCHYACDVPETTTFSWSFVFERTIPIGNKESCKQEQKKGMIKLEGAYEIMGSGTFILLNVAIERKSKDYGND